MNAAAEPAELSLADVMEKLARLEAMLSQILDGQIDIFHSRANILAAAAGQARSEFNRAEENRK